MWTTPWHHRKQNCIVKEEHTNSTLLSGTHISATTCNEKSKLNVGMCTYKTLEFTRMFLQPFSGSTYRNVHELSWKVRPGWTSTSQGLEFGSEI